MSTTNSIKYGSLDFSPIGECSIQNQSSRFMPDALGQKEIRRIGVKIETYQSDFDSNYSLLQQARTALQTQNQILTWTSAQTTNFDGATIPGTQYLSIPAIVVSHDLPEDPNSWGSYFQAINIVFEYELDITGNDTGNTIYLRPTFLQTGSAGTPISLGRITGERQGYRSTKYSEMRNIRERAAGSVVLTGYITAAFTTETVATSDTRQAQLWALKQQMDLQLKGRDGTLTYQNANGSWFNRIVRVQDFEMNVGQVVNDIPWTLTAEWTDFPNESTYAAADIHIGRGEDRESGEKSVRLTGKIGAPSPTLANSKLQYLMTAVLNNAAITDSDPLWKGLPPHTSEINPRFINSDDTQTNSAGVAQSPTNSVGSVDANGLSTSPTVFIELDFNIEWRKKSANLLSWKLTINTADDTASGLQVVTYSGSVVASGASANAAYAVAAAQAATLGDLKYQFRMKADVRRDDRAIDVGGASTSPGPIGTAPGASNGTGIQELVGCSFTYEYRVKGPRIYMESTTETVTETTGENSMRVHGFVVAPDYGTAQSTYLQQVKALYAENLILTETATQLQDAIQLGAPWTPPAGGQPFAAMFIRFDFSLSIWVGKPTGSATFQYRMAIEPDYTNLRKAVQIEGTAFLSQADLISSENYAAGNPMDIFLNTLAPAGAVKLKESRRQTVITTDGGETENQMALTFSVSFLAAITNPLHMILQCSLTETIKYTAPRLTKFPLPTVAQGPTIIQKTGIEDGWRRLSGTVTAATEAAAMIFVKAALALPFPSGSGGGVEPSVRYIEAPEISRDFEWLPLTTGVARATGQNVVMVKFSFSAVELLPLYPFNP